MSALDDLIKAAEDGARPWREPDDSNWPYARFALEAFDGSLDAALRLHEALLPGASQYSIVTDPTCLCVKVAWWPKWLSGGVEIQGEGWDEGNPARAWLLAILRALKAQEGRE